MRARRARVHSGPMSHDAPVHPRAPRAALTVFRLGAGLYILMAIGHTLGHLAAERPATGEKAHLYSLMRSVPLDLPGGFTGTMQGLVDFAGDTMALLWALVGALNLAVAPLAGRDAGALTRLSAVNLIGALALLALRLRTPAPPVVFYIPIVVLFAGALVILRLRRR